jgi:hypothetical protein
MFEIRPSSSAGLKCSIVGVHIDNTSEVGDAAEEMISYSILRMTGGTFSTGTGGTTPTPVPVNHGAVAASFAADAVNDAVATTSGTTVTVLSRGFNLRSGLDLWLPPECYISAPGLANVALLVRFNTTLADTVTWQGTCWVLEG